MKKSLLYLSFIFVLFFPISNSNSSFITKKSDEKMCVSKSFNANYRLSKWKCRDDEREIPKGTVEFNEGLEFIKISKLVIGSNSKAPTVYNNNKSEINTNSSDFGSKKNYHFCKTAWSSGSPYLTDSCPSPRRLNYEQYAILKLNYWAFGTRVKNKDPNQKKIIFNKVKNQIISEFNQKGLSGNSVYGIINSNPQFASLNDNNNSSYVKLASSKYITKKKSKNTEAVERIEEMYSQGLLSKKQCVKAKVKILKMKNSLSTICDNVKVVKIHKDDRPKVAEKKSYITKKEKEKIKEKKKQFIQKKKKEKFIQKKKTVKKYKNLKELPPSMFYFFAFDSNNKQLIGYVNEDPKSEMIKLNNRQFRKENVGYMFKEDGTICDILSTVERAKTSRIYSGTVDVNCPKGFYTGNWVQNGANGNGLAIDEKGRTLKFSFSMRKDNAIKLFEKEKEQTMFVKKQPEKKFEPKIKTFTPKKVEIDKIAPVVKTNSKIVSNSYNFTIEGSISDNKKHKNGPYLFIEDQPVDFNKRTGKFTFPLYSVGSTEIIITATDMFGNTSETRVEVQIDLKESQIAKKLEPLNPSKIRSKINANRVAVIIGIEKYDSVVSSDFSNLDAKIFLEYAKKGLGVPKQNIKMLIDEQATYAKSQVALHKWLKNKITPETTEVVIFFSGHGLAQQGKELYLFARDSDSEALEFTALNRKEIIKRISSYKPKSVLMFFDTCYSGQSRKGETLLAQARPIVPVEPKTGDIPNNFTIFSASSSTQLASAIKKPKHGIFSYYLMKGMEGKADADGNREITNEELYNYLASNVSQKAMEVHDRSQTPSFMGEKNFVISKY